MTEDPPPVKKQVEGWFKHEIALQSKTSPEDFRRIADARREIWTGGIIGLVLGLSGGFIVARVAPHKLQWWKKNHTLMTILLGGAMGSSVGSMKRGSVAVEGITDVFAKYSKPTTSYTNKIHQERLDTENKEAQEQELLLQKLAGSSTTTSSSSSSPSTSTSNITLMTKYDTDPYEKQVTRDMKTPLR